MSIQLPAPDILYEQGAVLVVNKPGGLLTQAPPGIDSLEWRIKAFLKRRDAKPGKVYLGVPHRLDRPVSGAMVFVKNVRAAKRLALQFQQRTVQKTYWAIVQGTVEPNQGSWIDWMRKVPDEPRSETVAKDHPNAQQAILHYHVVHREGDRSWLEIQLETGRTHQIRLQASTRDHPILGDAQYGGTVPFGPPSDDIRKRWIALHARHLGFEHPISREPVRQTAPLPESWAALPFDFERDDLH